MFTRHTILLTCIRRLCTAHWSG